MKVIFSDENIELTAGKSSIFLAGPTPRKKEINSWRPEALSILKSLNYQGDVLVPEKKDWSVKFEYEDQFNWERFGLDNCTSIVFWVPRKFPDMKALTTNVEFGVYITKTPSKVFYGRPDDAEQVRYLDLLYNKSTNRNPFINLRDILIEAINN